jgi:calcineurin-like phosphoesterase family protein
MIGKKTDQITALPGRKILVRGSHDRQWSNTRWMSAGFDFACDGLLFRNVWLSHEPSWSLPPGAALNIHGHLHNVWNGFLDDDPAKQDDAFMKTARAGCLLFPWQRLFALEYTAYRPVEMEKFVAHPDKYQARGPKKT